MQSNQNLLQIVSLQTYDFKYFQLVEKTFERQ